MLLHGQLNAAVTTVAASAIFSECLMFGLAVTIEMNGCQYGFNISEPAEGVADTYVGSAELSCPAGKKMVVKWSTCEIQVPSQTGVKSVKFINNTGSDDITLRLELSGITYEKVKDGFPSLSKADLAAFR